MEFDLTEKARADLYANAKLVSKVKHWAHHDNRRPKDAFAVVGELKPLKVLHGLIEQPANQARADCKKAHNHNAGDVVNKKDLQLLLAMVLINKQQT